MLSKPSIEDEETLKHFRDIYMGCCVAMMRDEDAEKYGFIFNGKPLSISCWRGKITVNLLASKNETEQILEKFPSEFKKVKAKEGGNQNAAVNAEEKQEEG